jgi:hypothetical protein
MAEIRAQLLASRDALEQLTADTGRWLHDDDDASSSPTPPLRCEDDSMFAVQERLGVAERELQLLARMEEREEMAVAMARAVLERRHAPGGIQFSRAPRDE